ncbi:MAG TPA: hypothetical protein DCK98_06910 [Chloroflexi bacterium]|nr:hypothetical protein [Chloroflexota bacterium]HAL25710.1 hypothetical protein [Chloroflexota bacterium]
MSHRLGSVLTPIVPFVIGPDSGLPATVGNMWERSFSPPAAPGGTKFLMLHLIASNLIGGDRVEVDLGYDTDIFTAASGPSFWTRPIAGNSVTIRYVDNSPGPSAGNVAVSQYGRGEGLKLGGADGVNGGNTNGDLFLTDSPYTEPTFFNAGAVCPDKSNPSWENVACMPAGLQKDIARSVGMFVHAEGDALTSCSAALIGPDLILTAAHCLPTQAEVDSAAFTLDYQTNCDGTRPVGYSPRFLKLTRLVKTGVARPAGDLRPTLDYSVVQFDAGATGVGAPALAIRPGLPAVGEELFVVHHPRGVTKKISRKPADPTCQVLSVIGNTIYYACDSDNGSSGSPVLDSLGRIVAVNDWAPGSCNNEGQAAAAILQDFIDPMPPIKDMDVMLVLDRSGSMTLSGVSGDSKMTEAKRAAALFLDLIRTDRTHRVGIVSFSDTVTLDSVLTVVNSAAINILIGPSPARTSGIVGGITAGGWTSIGGGLQRAQTQFPAPGPATNTRAILLMTDGLQNTPPMVADVEGALGGTQLDVIGFGGAGDLDGALLARLARDHRGLYSRAGEGLALKKFFVLAFGNIFQSGISLDPVYTIKANAISADPIALGVCGEDSIAVVLGWEHPGSDLILSLTAPGGLPVASTTPGIIASRGDTWAYLRFPLPFAGQRDGNWVINVTRLGSGGELAPSLPAERFFVTTLVEGGPVMRPPTPRRYYTGDLINPLVSFRHPDGGRVDARMTLEVEVPGESVGNVLARSGLHDPMSIGGDQLSAAASTLIALDQAQGGALIPTELRTFELFDDETHEEGALEPDGVYGNPLVGLTRHEGNYTFHARAVFGDACQTSRETTWSAYVSIGIDPITTAVKTTTLGALPGGRKRVRITVTPKDRYGNYLGPGRLGDFELRELAGSQPLGPLTDAGDGSYVQDVAWDLASGRGPGVTLDQPGRPPVIASPPAPASGRASKGCLFLLVLALVAILSSLVVNAGSDPDR